MCLLMCACSGRVEVYPVYRWVVLFFFIAFAGLLWLILFEEAFTKVMKLSVSILEGDSLHLCHLQLCFSINQKCPEHAESNIKYCVIRKLITFRLMSKDRQPLLNEGKLVKLKSKDMQNVLNLEIKLVILSLKFPLLYLHTNRLLTVALTSQWELLVLTIILLLLLKGKKKVRALLLTLFLSTHSVFPFSFYLAHSTFLFLSLNPRLGKCNQNLKSDTWMDTYGTSVVIYFVGLLGMITRCLSWLSPKCVLASRL